MIQRQLPGWHRVQQAILFSTALGVMIHELAHKEMAEEFNLGVQEVKYFQMEGGKAGYVTHDTPRTYTGMVAVSIAPFILNTAVAYTAFVLGGGYAFYYGVETLQIWEWVLVASCLWLGVSAGLHAFPSRQDIGNIWSAAKSIWAETKLPIIQPLLAKIRNRHIVLRIVLFPLWLPIFLIRMAVFSIWNYRVMLSFPVMGILVVLDKFKPFGSHFAFTAAILWSSYYSLGFIFPNAAL
jgi:hypothetical protein